MARNVVVERGRTIETKISLTDSHSGILPSSTATMRIKEKLIWNDTESLSLLSLKELSGALEDLYEASGTFKNSKSASP